MRALEHNILILDTTRICVVMLFEPIGPVFIASHIDNFGHVCHYYSCKVRAQSYTFDNILSSRLAVKNMIPQ